MGISTTTGLGTGLNITQLVTQLVNSETQPVYDALKTRETSTNAKLSALGSVKSALSTLSDAAKALNSTGSIATQTVSVSDTTRMSASVGAGAVSGKYSVEVTSLAQAARVTTQAFSSTAPVDPSGNSAFSIMMTGGASLSIPISATATLADLRNAINGSASNPGVTATILNADDGSHLLVTATKTGVANGFTLANTAGTGLGATTALSGVDASVTINGSTLTRPSNQITDAVDGLTLNLVKTTDSGSPLTLTVASDNSALQNKLTALVNAYNNMTTVLKNQSAYNATTKTLSPLAGDSMIQTLQRSVRKALTDPVAGVNASYASLASVGVTVDRYGVMSLDSSKLNKAIAAEGSGVLTNLLNSSGGVITRISSFMNNYVSGSGTFSARTDSLNKVLRDITVSRQEEDDRAAKLQASLSRQFQAMDSMVAKINSTGSYLTKMLG